MLRHEEQESFGDGFESEVMDKDIGSINNSLPLPKLPKMSEKPNAHEKLVEWRKYKRSIEYYFDLMKHKLPTVKKLQLLYLGGGSEIQKALEHFVLPTHDNDELAYVEMLLHMDKHFQTGVDSLAYMMQLLGMKQGSSEPFADFVQRLKAQADLCELGTARENLLKSQIQKGARNAKIFASAEAWVNKSLDDIVGLGIADETNTQLLASNAKQEAVNAQIVNDEETVGRVSEDGRSSKRFPRSWRRSGYNNFSGNYAQSRPGSSRNMQNQQRAYPYSNGQGRSNGTLANVRCFNCHKFGHMMKNCKIRNVYSIDNTKVEDDLFE